MPDDILVKSGKEVETSIEESRAPSFLEDPAVQVIRGSRPNLRYLLQKEVELTSGRIGVTGSCCRLSINLFLVANLETETKYVALHLSLLLSRVPSIFRLPGHPAS
jgi:hypothetical protein